MFLQRRALGSRFRLDLRSPIGLSLCAATTSTSKKRNGYMEYILLCKILLQLYQEPMVHFLPIALVPYSIYSCNIKLNARWSSCRAVLKHIRRNQSGICRKKLRYRFSMKQPQKKRKLSDVLSMSKKQRKCHRTRTAVTNSMCRRPF